MKLNEPGMQKKSPSASNKEPAQRDGRTRRPMHRIYQIHASIRSGSLPNCSTLAQTLEVDRKTVQRDITFMRDAMGLPLVYCEDLHGYLMIAILHKQLKLPGTLHRTLQVLSVHPFEKVTLNELLTETDHRTFINSDPNQLNLF